MKKSDRRFFLKSSGLLLGGLLISRLGVSQPLSRTARFKLKLDLRNVNFFFTGNLNFKQHLDVAVAPLLQNMSGVYLDAGNFTEQSKTKTMHRVAQMNAFGYQAAALGKHEMAIGEDNLLRLAKSCDFTLVNSLTTWRNPELSNWIKPFQLVEIADKNVAVLATAPMCPSNQEVVILTSLAKQLKKEQQCDLAICLVPNGLKKKELLELVRESGGIDVFFCVATDAPKDAIYILRNKDKKEATLIYGGKEAIELGHYAANMKTAGYVLPNRIACCPPKNPIHWS
ncbi:bifunctional UDP-sugar hydrolase/5'-nucleotidase [Sphingobacterium yanglingense]|uniref:2',3'-cyclic-nucleotide 2'-phosphodiesterase (5'-nucleotidase family) n=1 Tax=Sphingobacterium yanglingense TaxID=1437280 RepID=A0A4R6WEP7_9SPHI|nr:hypothetical protein [Sphingobacterium yanglingense]TDQ73710.1 hypothetical protein CLV99_4147 [Sphingobacterium yanglingense]